MHTKIPISPDGAPSDRGVSEVLGEALLIALAVVLASVIGFIVLNVNLTGPAMPMADLDFTQEPAGTGEYNITVTHVSGDDLPADTITVKIADNSGDGDDAGTFSESMAAGDSQVIATNVEEGDIVRLIWDDPGSDVTRIVGEYTVK